VPDGVQNLLTLDFVVGWERFAEPKMVRGEFAGQIVPQARQFLPHPGKLCRVSRLGRSGKIRLRP
jgi:hypothetical protein